MSQAKLYKVKLAQGFNAAGRNRAGISVEKGVTQVLELTDEQVKALKADVWFVIAEAGKDDKPGSTPDATGGSQGGEEEVTDPYEGVSFKDLKAQATEAGLDIKGLKSRADVIAVLEAAKSEGGEEEGDDEEEIELSEDMTLEQLKEIATTQGVEELDQYTDENKADLIKAIEEASETEE